ncbi:hypothetical protein [Thiorhodococcus minor]|uniref:Uncharacterized protein n=1 Tax=Thiorhodococcus minor TaxID=57489 RepID=A0A6M0JXE8_9GAMM|nr:hypothetical protein [Thiorhodococcus minor]NEV62218.1 hypothetical protein [Thiorhodococcus minor]
MAKIERAHESWEPVRQAAQAMLQHDSEHFAELLRTDEGSATALELAQQLEAYLEWRNSQTEALQAVSTRLWLAIRRRIEQARWQD